MGALPQSARTEKEVMRMKTHFIPFYDEHKCDRTRPYNGIYGMLDRLTENGIRLAVASNKYQDGTEKLVRRFFRKYSFVRILGQRDGMPIKPDPMIVTEAMSAAGISDKADVIYSLQLCNICTERIRIIPSFCQLNYSNVFSIVVDETSFELAPATSVVFNLKLHVITINSLDAKQMAELLDTTILAGKLQLVADIARRQFQQDVIRTVVKTPVKVQLQFKPVIAVFPPVLNILTVVEHYSKMEDLLEPHFEENSQTVLSETSEIETNSGSNVSSPICEFSSELEGIDDETPHLRNSVLNTGFVVSRLVRNTVQIQIQNRWRERIQVNLCSTKLEHRKQAVFYSDHETPAFASFIELPEIIVIDPESTVSVLATLLPDFETPIVRIEFSLFHPIEHPRKRVSRGNRAASQRIHRPSSHDSRGNPLLHKSESVLHGR